MSSLVPKCLPAHSRQQVAMKPQRMSKQLELKNMHIHSRIWTVVNHSNRSKRIKGMIYNDCMIVIKDANHGIWSNVKNHICQISFWRGVWQQVLHGAQDRNVQYRPHTAVRTPFSPKNHKPSTALDAISLNWMAEMNTVNTNTSILASWICLRLLLELLFQSRLNVLLETLSKLCLKFAYWIV